VIRDAAFLFNADFTRSDETCCWSGSGPGGQRGDDGDADCSGEPCGENAAANDKIQLYSGAVGYVDITPSALG
jgi:hypothetical protein